MTSRVVAEQASLETGKRTYQTVLVTASPSLSLNWQNSTLPCLLCRDPLSAPHNKQAGSKCRTETLVVLPSGSPLASEDGQAFLYPRHPPPRSNPSVSSLGLRPLVCPLPAPVSFHCPPKKRSKAIQACSCDLFNGLLPTGRVPLFLGPFLPGSGAISKGASVFPLRGGRGAPCLLGVIMDHTWSCSSGSPRAGGPGAWAQAPGPGSRLPPARTQNPLLLLSLLSGPFHWAQGSTGPLCDSYVGAQLLSIHSLVFVLSTYNMPPTSIPEMPWMQLFLSVWMCLSKEGRKEVFDLTSLWSFSFFTAFIEPSWWSW